MQDIMIRDDDVDVPSAAYNDDVESAILGFQVWNCRAKLLHLCWKFSSKRKSSSDCNMQC